MKDDLFKTIEKFEPQMVSLLSGLIRIPAISPLGGGTGEYRESGLYRRKHGKDGFGKPEYTTPRDPTAEEG